MHFGDYAWITPRSGVSDCSKTNTCVKKGVDSPCSGAYGRFNWRRFHETAPAALRSEGDGNTQNDDGKDLESGQGPAIADAVAQIMFCHRGTRGQHNSELISQPRNKPAGRIGGKLTEVGRDDTPGALNTHLH